MENSNEKSIDYVVNDSQIEKLTEVEVSEAIDKALKNKQSDAEKLAEFKKLKVQVNRYIDNLVQCFDKDGKFQPNETQAVFISLDQSALIAAIKPQHVKFAGFMQAAKTGEMHLIEYDGFRITRKSPETGAINSQSYPIAVLIKSGFNLKAHRLIGKDSILWNNASDSFTGSNSDFTEEKKEILRTLKAQFTIAYKKAQELESLDSKGIETVSQKVADSKQYVVSGQAAVKSAVKKINTAIASEVTAETSQLLESMRNSGIAFSPAEVRRNAAKRTEQQQKAATGTTNQKTEASQKAA